MRLDSGVSAGCTVPAEFDSLIAKLIATGETREEARARLVCALTDFELVVAGGATNKGYLIDILETSRVSPRRLRHGVAGPHTRASSRIRRLRGRGIGCGCDSLLSALPRCGPPEILCGPGHAVSDVDSVFDGPAGRPHGWCRKLSARSLWGGCLAVSGSSRRSRRGRDAQRRARQLGNPRAGRPQPARSERRLGTRAANRNRVAPVSFHQRARRPGPLGHSCRGDRFAGRAGRSGGKRANPSAYSKR